MADDTKEESSGTDRRVRPRIGITLGDPNGIGPEVVIKCLLDSRLIKFMEPVVIGSSGVLRQHAERLNIRDLRMKVVEEVPERLPEGVVTVLDVIPGESPRVDFGKITAEGGALAMKAVEVATDLSLDGRLDAMVTAPISKEAISLAGYTDPGHTEFIARRTSTTEYMMMMVAGEMRIGLVTVHMAIWDVPRAVTREEILRKIRILTASLQNDFQIVRPRIAVLGLNPHAGDGGVLGREEEDTIIPSIRQACDEGYLAFGPFAADGFFAIGGYRNYDAVLAMYHDQGLVPFKTLAFESGVNFTAGLPIVRTSPDHGTAYDIAGQGKASPGSMRSAIYTAIDISRNRLARGRTNG